MELLLPPRPFRAAPLYSASSSLFYVAAMVHVRWARHQPRTYSLHAGQAGLRFYVVLLARGFLVDASGR